VQSSSQILQQTNTHLCIGLPVALQSISTKNTSKSGGNSDTQSATFRLHSTSLHQWCTKFKDFR